MTKREVLKYCEEKREEGYITHTIILDLFEEDEEVSDDVVSLICYKPTPPIEPVWVVGSEFYALLKEEAEKYLIYLDHTNMIEKYKCEHHEN